MRDDVCVPVERVMGEREVSVTSQRFGPRASEGHRDSVFVAFVAAVTTHCGIKRK